MNSIKIISLFLIISLQSCFGQKKSTPKTIKIEEFNWTVTIPENFHLTSEAILDNHLKKGLEIIEKNLGEEIINQAVTIFSFNNGDFNNLEALWQPYDVGVDGDYMELYTEVNEIIYKTLETQMPEVKLDSVTTSQKICGLDFLRFDMDIDYLNGLEMKIINFTRLFSEKEFTFNITYMDEQIGEKMINAFLESKFNGLD